MPSSRRDTSHRGVSDTPSPATSLNHINGESRWGHEVSDADLVGRCRAGESKAWCDLVDRYGPYVNVILRAGYSLSRSDAEDAFQEVFVRVFLHINALRDPGAFRPWIAQMTRRVASDSANSRSWETPSDEIDLLPGSPDARDEVLDVVRALRRVSHVYRDALVRHLLMGESYDVIAVQIGAPMGTVASRINRGLAELRVLLS
jgi:RNA polymerase sigma-70 factor, ECF subfamily